MRKIYLAVIIYFLFTGFTVQAQENWLPPVNFLSGTQLCDYTDWKLVFYDDFEGTQLTPQWHTYLVWNSMAVENDNWNGARDSYHNALYKDENVFVSDGTCKILIKNEPFSWKCDTCTEADRRTKNLTAGTLSTYFKKKGKPSYFNSGKFESRIKFPTKEGTWAAFWLWHGTQVNEIDIAESYGTRNGKRPLNTYNLHAWKPNRYSSDLPNDAAVENSYPMQSWYHQVLGNYFNQGDWHTYTCIWERTHLSFYVDGHWVNTIWKYYRYRDYNMKSGGKNVRYRYKVYPTCEPEPGEWEITYGYPHYNNPQSNLRINTSMLWNHKGNPDTAVYEIDRMEIDYVKIWQRNPGLDGHRNIWESVRVPKIYGKESFGKKEMFVAYPVNKKGFWELSDTLNFKIEQVHIQNDSSFVTVVRKGEKAEVLNEIYYHYSVGKSFPLQKTSFKFHCFEVMKEPVQFVVDVQQEKHRSFSLFVAEEAEVANLPVKYDWKISYDNGDGQKQNYHRVGKYISVPATVLKEGQSDLLSWEVVASDLSGKKLFAWKGSRTSNSRLGRDKGNAKLYFVNATIPIDSVYEDKVKAAVEKLFFPPDVANREIENNIERIRIEQLEPYLKFE